MRSQGKSVRERERERKRERGREGGGEGRGKRERERGREKGGGVVIESEHQPTARMDRHKGGGGW